MIGTFDEVAYGQRVALMDAGEKFAEIKKVRHEISLMLTEIKTEHQSLNQWYKENK